MILGFFLLQFFVLAMLLVIVSLVSLICGVPESMALLQSVILVEVFIKFQGMSISYTLVHQ